MKIDAVYLWLYNVALLISVWKKHCAFQKRLTQPFSNVRLLGRHYGELLVVGVLTQDVWQNQFFSTFVLEGLHLTFKIRCIYAIQDIQ